MDGDQPGGGAALTEQHVIIIAVVCGVIIISLLAVLVWFICRRKRHLHQHQKDAADSPQRAMPMNGTAVGVKKSSAGGYDNTDGGHDGQSRPDVGGGSGQFLDLGEKRGDNSGWPESGYSTPDPATATKPKKVIYEVIV